MDKLNGFEIYIPKEAEVKTIPLWSLPNSMLKWMGLPQSDTESSKNLAASPEGTWISPAVIRKRGHPSASHTEETAKEHMSSLLTTKPRTAQGPFQMSFVSSNHAAYKVLGDTLHGRNVSTQVDHKPPCPLGSPRHKPQDAVIIYRGRVYLSIKRPKRDRCQVDEPNPAVQARLSDSHPPATSAAAPESPKMELLNDSKLKKNDGVPQAEKEDEFMDQEGDAFSSKAAHFVPQSSGGIHKVDALCQKTVRKDLQGEQAVKEDARGPATFHQGGGEEEEEVVVVNKADPVVIPTGSEESEMEDSSCPEADPVVIPTDSMESEMEDSGCPEADPVVIPTGSAESEMEDSGCLEAESDDANDAMDLQVSSGEADEAPAAREGSNGQSWTRGASFDLAFASTPAHQEFTFEQLAQEEKISRMRAKLRESEAALSNLQSSK